MEAYGKDTEIDRPLQISATGMVSVQMDVLIIEQIKEENHASFLQDGKEVAVLWFGDLFFSWNNQFGYHRRKFEL